MSALRWVVRASDGSRVAEVVARLEGTHRDAAAEGRAFLNGRRAGEQDPVRAGDVLEIWDAHSGDSSVTILARRDELVIVDKPAGLPTEPDRRGLRSVVRELQRALDCPAPPHADSRLDVGVSGALLCALGERGRREAVAARADGRVRRTYVAIASGDLRGAGHWEAPVQPPGGSHPLPARTRWKALAWAPTVAQQPRATMLRLEPETGRTHQLRIHAHLAGHPLLGDRVRGGPRNLVTASGRVMALERIALHAVRVEVLAPPGAAASEPLSANAPIPGDLQEIWATLDGAAAAWDDLGP